MDSDYNFEIVDNFSHYISSRDKTNLTPTAYVKNSKNVYKKRSGTIANRPGLKARGALNPAQVGVVASFEWDGPFANPRVIRVTSDGKLSIEYDNNDGRGPIWYDLVTGLAKTRFIFNGSYIDTVQGKEILLAANGSILSLWNWEGGISQIASATPLVPGVILQGNGFGFSLGSQGSGYSIGDILNILAGDQTAQVVVASVGNTGNVTALNPLLNNQGTGYSVNNGVATSNNARPSATGCTVNILSVYSAGTVTKSNLNTTFIQDGFSQNSSEVARQWKFVVNGVTYSYGGINDDTLTGVTPDPSAIPSGAIAISAFIEVSNIPFSGTAADSPLIGTVAQNFEVDVLNVISNQVYIGSYTSPTVFISSNTDYTDYNPVINGGLGTPDNFDLNSNLKGISVRNNIPIIFAGTSEIAQVNISQLTIPTVGPSNTSIIVQIVGVTEIFIAENGCPISQEFIDTEGNYIVWLGQDHQVHNFGAFKDILLSDKTPILSYDVYDELVNVDFTNGALRLIGEFIYLTAPVQGTHYVYQTREYVDELGGTKSERIWNAPFIAGISRIANIDGVIYGHSYLNPMIYQLWDTGQWHDDDPNGDPAGIAYECVLAMAYQQLPGKGKNNTLRFNKTVFDKIAVEGYMSRGTPLFGKIYFDYQGATDIQIININTPAIPNIPVQPYLVKNVELYSYSTAPALATDTLADNPLGEGITFSPDQQDYLPKFRAIRKVKPTDCFEYGIEFYSYALDARWEILAFGVNITPAQRVPRELL